VFADGFDFSAYGRILGLQVPDYFLRCFLLYRGNNGFIVLLQETGQITNLLISFYIKHRGSFKVTYP
jgi:hypothetical protein